MFFDANFLNASLHSAQYLLEDGQDIEFFKTIMKAELSTKSFNSIKFEKVQVDKGNGIITIFCETKDKEERIIKVGAKSKLKAKNLSGQTLYESEKYIIKVPSPKEKREDEISEISEKGFPDVYQLDVEDLLKNIGNEIKNKRYFISSNIASASFHSDCSASCSLASCISFWMIFYMKYF